MKPIAFFHCDKKSPAEAARQGAVDSSGKPGEIRFLSGCQFESALEDIEGFSHLWLLYHFHHNSDWKSKVQPPRGSEKKKGLFSTRSPYRPNPIGMSCVELIKKDHLSLWVQHFDLLDQTPIWDVKPYLAYADAFPEATLGWLAGIQEEEYSVAFSIKALEQLQFLKSRDLSQIENLIRNQLAYDPLNSQKKRVKVLSESSGILSYRTWRVQFEVGDKKVQVTGLFSGYSISDLLDPEDPYQDKNLHYEFNNNFPS